MAVEVRDRPEQLRYEALVDGQPAGFVTYRLHGGHITFVHTEIDPGYDGRGVGSALARGALDDARERSLCVVPICPFITAFIRGHAADYLEVVAPGMRGRVMGEAHPT